MLCLLYNSLLLVLLLLLLLLLTEDDDMMMHDEKLEYAKLRLAALRATAEKLPIAGGPLDMIIDHLGVFYYCYRYHFYRMLLRTGTMIIDQLGMLYYYYYRYYLCHVLVSAGTTVTDMIIDQLGIPYYC
jgi:DNA-directed RNA polymerase subunit N (RpoN/RPB10)